MLKFAYGHENKVYFSRSQCSQNQQLTLNQLINHIKREPPQSLAKIRQICRDGFSNGIEPKTIKKQIKSLKNNLDWLLLSGFCPIHHNNETLEYNGVIQIDIDFKFRDGDIKARELKNILSKRNDIMFAAISPSGFGVKAAIHTENTNIKYHKKIIDAIILKLSNELKIDTKYFDSLGASQPCFVPYDADVFYNQNYEKFDSLGAIIEFEQIKTKRDAIVKNQNATARTRSKRFENSPSNLKNDTDIIEYLTSEIEKNRIDLTDTFKKWCAVAFSCASVGSRGLQYFHRIAQMNNSYEPNENDRLFADALKNGKSHKHLGYLINECKNANINLSPIFEKKFVEYTKPQNTVFLTLSAHEFLSTKVSRDDFSTGVNCIRGGCGIGKTYFVANGFERTIVVSRNVTTLQNYEKYGFKKFSIRDAVPMFSGHLPNKITVTYKSFSKLLESENLDGYVFIFDEAHLLNESFSKIERETRFCYDSIKTLSATNIVILMSANVLNYNDDITINKSFFVRKIGINKRVNVFYNSNLHRLKNSIQTALKHKKQVLLYTNRKEHFHKISEFLKSNFQNNSIFFFDSKKHGFDLENLSHDITVTTSALETGKDILNENMMVIFYDLSKSFEMIPSRASLVQFLGRVRRYQSAQYEIHFERKENSNFGTYSLFDIRNNRLKTARDTVKYSKNDITYFIENKARYVKKLDGKYVIDYFNIDKSISRAVSFHTLLNGERLREFLKNHNYTAHIETLDDIETIEPIEPIEKLSKIEMYKRECDILEIRDFGHEFQTNAKKRYDLLSNRMITHEFVMQILRVYDSRAKWYNFVNLLAVEYKIMRDEFDDFCSLHFDIYTITDTPKTSKFIIKNLANIRTAHNFELARIVKMCRDVDVNNDNEIKKIFSHLRNYYKIDTVKTARKRFYQFKYTSFFLFFENDNISLEYLNELRKLCVLV